MSRIETKAARDKRNRDQATLNAKMFKRVQKTLESTRVKQTEDELRLKLEELNKIQARNLKLANYCVSADKRVNKEINRIVREEHKDEGLDAEIQKLSHGIRKLNRVAHESTLKNQELHAKINYLDMKVRENALKIKNTKVKLKEDPEFLKKEQDLTQQKFLTLKDKISLQKEEVETLDT